MSSKAENCEAIARYIIMELVKMGYHVKINRSTKSEDSWYIKIYTGTRDNPGTIRVRISDHNTLFKYSAMSWYDFDISVSRYRENAITFIDFFAFFAFQQKKQIPREIAGIISATMRDPIHLQAA